MNQRRVKPHRKSTHVEKERAKVGSAVLKGSLSFGSFPFPPAQLPAYRRAFRARMWTQSHAYFPGWIPWEISETEFQKYSIPRMNLFCRALPSLPFPPHKMRFNFKLQQNNSAVYFWLTLPNKLPHGDYVMFWLLNVLDKFSGKQTCPMLDN